MSREKLPIEKTELQDFDLFVNQAIKEKEGITTGQAVNLWKSFQRGQIPASESNIFKFLRNEVNKENS